MTTRRQWARIGSAAATAVLAGGLTLAPSTASAAGPAVLRVGTWHGIAGQFTSIQAAVDAARPGDWVLVAPGDYHENADYTSHQPDLANGKPGAGVWITTPRLHLRGVSRGGVVVDGTRAGAPSCSRAPGDQLYGPLDPGSHPVGRNGVEIVKANNVSVENLTVCNFLAGNDGSGNQIWWNGGYDSAQVNGHGFLGRYLTATSTFYGGLGTAATYGIFSSNWSGGTWDDTYASNFDDSGYYIGACQQVCDQTVNHAWAEFNALGYSGSNSGGSLVVKNSEFDHNEDGFDTNSQNGDNPPPQDGRCPGGAISPITHTTSCWVFMNNFVHDNNNPNVPAAGLAAVGPVGTGMSLSGGRNDTVMNNRFVHNGAWGTIIVPFPDSGPPCTGGTLTPALCLYDTAGNAVINNTYSGNGFFGNPTNADIGETRIEPGAANCYHGNTDTSGTLTTSPPQLQTLESTCGSAGVPDPNAPFLDEVACDSQNVALGPLTGGATCLPGSNYPRRTRVVMHPLPAQLPGLANPCAGVPANPWCPAPVPAGPDGRSLSGSGGTPGVRTVAWRPGRS